MKEITAQLLQRTTTKRMEVQYHQPSSQKRERPPPPHHNTNKKKQGRSRGEGEGKQKSRMKRKDKRLEKGEKPKYAILVFLHKHVLAPMESRLCSTPS